MKGYKGMDKDMQCRGMQYEVGKTYHVGGNIKLCENGLHFCENLFDVFNFYDNDGSNRFFEVIAAGVIASYGNKCAASHLKIIRELSRIEINRSYYGRGNSYGDGYGDGYGNGYGDNGDGYGDGNGYGVGNNGDGYGDGNSNGRGIQNILFFL